MHSEAALRDRIDELEEEVRQLRELLRPAVSLPPSWRLAPRHREMLLCLYAAGGQTVTHERFRAALSKTDEWVSEKNATVLLCQLRKRLPALGLSVQTVWGVGLRLDPDSVAIIREALRADTHPLPQRSLAPCRHAPSAA